MDAGKRSSPSALLLLLFLLLFLSSAPFPPPVQGGGDGEEGAGRSQGQQEPQLAERAIGITGAGFGSRWDVVRAWVKLALINLRSLHSMIRNERSESSTGRVVRQAVKRSMEESKETVEKSAKSAAKVAEKAVQKTKETAKRLTAALTPEEHVPDAEL